MEQAKAEEAEDMEEGQGFRHGSEDPREEDSQEATHSIGRAKRTPRGGRAFPGRSGSGVRP